MKHSARDNHSQNLMKNHDKQLSFDMESVIYCQVDIKRVFSLKKQQYFDNLQVFNDRKDQF